MALQSYKDLEVWKKSMFYKVPPCNGVIYMCVTKLIAVTGWHLVSRSVKL